MCPSSFVFTVLTISSVEYQKSSPRKLTKKAHQIFADMIVLAALVTSLAIGTHATYIRKWNLEGCPGSGISERCNSLPSGHCCNKGSLRGGSVRIDNLPSYVDISVPYNGRRAGTGSSHAAANHCANVRISQVRFGGINCLSGGKVGTGTWIHCSQSYNADKCFNMHSHPKRTLGDDGEDDDLDMSNFEYGHPGYVDEEEAALPPISYHDGNGDMISKEEYDRLSELELAHEANGTLNLLYPESYPANYLDYYHDIPDNTTIAEFISENESDESEPQQHHARTAEAEQTDGEDDDVEDDDGEDDDLGEDEIFKRAPDIDVAAYVNKQCRGERLGVATKKGVCHTTINGASISVGSLSNNCKVVTFPKVKCKGSKSTDVGKGGGPGCFDDGNFSSFKVKCS